MPPGAPSATMKTLSDIDAAISAFSNDVEQVESRIDLATIAGDSTYAHVIHETGSYYLSSNLVLTDRSGGIYIDASDVTIDLNGFEITKESLEGSYGINANWGSSRLYVKNGSIHFI